MKPRQLGFAVQLDKANVTARLFVDEKFVLKTRRSHGVGKLDGIRLRKIRGQMKLNAPSSPAPDKSNGGS